MTKTKKSKTVSRHKVGDKSYPRITITGKTLSDLGFEHGDDIEIVTDDTEEFVIKIKKSEEE